MTMLDTIKGWFDRDRPQFIFESIPKDQVTGTGAATATAAVSGLHYFRLSVAEMYLQKKVSWFRELYPAVHSLVRLTLGGRQGVEIPHITDLSSLGINPAARASGDVEMRMIRLTPMLPFNGGDVAITVGLIVVEGKNYAATAIRTLGSFASILTVPQFSSMLQLAAPLAEGIRGLFGDGNGQLYLGLLQTLSAGTLVDGYIALVRATDAELDRRSLAVQNGSLRVRDDKGALASLTAFDYLLLRIEVFTERDDWDSLQSIAEPYREALSALGAQDERRAADLARAACVAAFKAPELTEAHRRAVIEKIKERYQAAQKSLQISAFAGESGFEASLSDAMAGARAKAAFDRGPIASSEVFGE